MNITLDDPRVVTTLLVLAIWLTAWIVGLVALRVSGARFVSPSLAVLTPPALALWIGWVWLR